MAATARPHTASPATDRASLAHRAADRLAQLSGEGALDVVARARALEQQGRDIAILAIGEPQFSPPPHAIEAGIAAIREGDARYGPPEGLAALRGAIATHLATRGIGARAEDVIVTPGAKPMLFYAFLATVNPGDEVLLPDPGFPIYPSLTRFAGGTPVGYALSATGGFAPDVDDIAARITPRTRVLVLNGPHNPTGGTISERALVRIAELVVRHDLIVISDEIYGRIVYDDARGTPSIAAVDASLRDRTIVVDGFSKAYAMTGWRLGYGLLPHWLVPAVTTFAVNGHTCTPPFVQRAGIAALGGSQDTVTAMVAELHRRRDAAVAALRSIPGVRCEKPAGAFYAFPDVSAALAATGLTAPQLATRLLEEHGVAVLPGGGFGERGASHLRVSFAGSAGSVADGLTRIARGIATIAGRGHAPAAA